MAVARARCGGGRRRAPELAVRTRAAKLAQRALGLREGPEAERKDGCDARQHGCRAAVEAAGEAVLRHELARDA